MHVYNRKVDWHGVKAFSTQKAPALRQALRAMIAQCETHTICAEVHAPADKWERRPFALVQCWFPHTEEHTKRNRRVTNDGPPSRLEFLTDDEQDMIAALVAEAVASVGD